MIYKIGDQVVLRPDLSEKRKQYYLEHWIYSDVVYTIKCFVEDGTIDGSRGLAYKLVNAKWVFHQDVSGSFEENLKKILE